MVQAQSDAVMQNLWRPHTQQAQTQVYAILDAARDERISPGLIDSGTDHVCLYRGALAQELVEVAPYLVHLRQNAPFSHWLLSLGWGNSWGIFLQSLAPMRELRRHFRRFLMVYDEQAKPLYFRYYDPRVLQVYLPTCNAEELNIVFGPVNAYHMEDEDGNGLMTFTQQGEHLVQHHEQLANLRPD